MQAILSSRHQRFSNWMKDVKMKQPDVADKINELENGLHFLYQVYQHKLQELRQVVEEYEHTQRFIQNEIKRGRKNNLEKTFNSSLYVRR